MTPERLRDLLCLALKEHEEIVAAEPVRTVYSDRLACAAEDEDHQLWRIHVIREPLK